jgi:hypothetical protein
LPLYWFCFSGHFIFAHFMRRLCSTGCVFTLSFALIAAADLNASVPMILIGRIIGGLAVGEWHLFTSVNF